MIDGINDFLRGVIDFLMGVIDFLMGVISKLQELQVCIEELQDFIMVLILIILVLIILALTAVVSNIRRFLFEFLEQESQNKESLWNAFVTSLQKPAGLIIWIVGVSFALEFIHSKTNAWFLAEVAAIRSIAIIAALAWFFIRFNKNLNKKAILTAISSRFKAISTAISSKFNKKDKDDE